MVTSVTPVLTRRKWLEGLIEKHFGSVVGRWDNLLGITLVVHPSLSLPKTLFWLLFTSTLIFPPVWTTILSARSMTGAIIMDKSINIVAVIARFLNFTSMSRVYSARRIVKDLREQSKSRCCWRKSSSMDSADEPSVTNWSKPVIEVCDPNCWLPEYDGEYHCAGHWTCGPPARSSYRHIAIED